MQGMQRRSEVVSWPRTPDSGAEAEHATHAHVYTEHGSGQGGVTPRRRDTKQALVETEASGKDCRVRGSAILTLHALVEPESEGQ